MNKRNEVEAAFARRDYLLSNFEVVEGPIEGSPCWEWQRCRVPPSYYGAIRYQANDYKAHRLSWIVHHNEIPKDLRVLHRCDIPYCVNPDHLWLGTQQDNVTDMCIKGRHGECSGELQSNAVFTDLEVSNIKGLLLLNSWRGFETMLARRYGVHRNTIYDIASGKRYGHVEPSATPVMPPSPGPPIKRRRIT
jgi:hypothetical protein